MKFHLPTALLFTLIAISHPEVAAAEGSAIQVDGATLRLLAIGGPTAETLERLSA